MSLQKTRVREFWMFPALSFLIIVILELSMALAYKITNLKYFGSKIELFDLRTGHTKTSRNVLINTKSTKVTLFGGSSSVGFASPINFAGLLNNPDYSIENLHVTNYGVAGAPFSGDQAEMAKAVI